MKEWQRLVHVCQRWRRIIYGLPSFFDLHLCCSAQTPYRNNLSHWPEFPLTLHYVVSQDTLQEDEYEDMDIFFSLLDRNRVHRIELIVTDVFRTPLMDQVKEVFILPFPVLTHLDITGPDEEFDDVPIRLPELVAPRLQHLRLDAFTYPPLLDFLSSAHRLVSLQLENIPEEGYIAPGDLVGGLASLSSLRTLCIKFPLWLALLERERLSPDPSTHAVLPALTHFVFRGKCDYLEALVTHISTPQVEDVQIEYLMPDDDHEHPVEVEARELSQFIDRTGYLGFAQFSRAQVIFDLRKAHIKLDRPQGKYHQAQFSLTLRYTGPLPLAKLNFPVPRIARVLGQLVVVFSDVGHLSINVENHGKTDRFETAKWFPLLRLFPAAETLHVSGRLAGHFATVLDDIAEKRVTDVLSALGSLHLGDGDELVGFADLFLAWRRYTGRPVTVVKSSQDRFVE